MGTTRHTSSVRLKGGTVGREKETLYDETIRDFLDSEEKLRVIHGPVLEGRTAGTVQVMLNQRLKELEKQHLVLVRKLPPSKVEFVDKKVEAALRDEEFVIVLELRDENNPYKPQPRKPSDEDKSS
jgi:hypothetical protein